jgi:hypothetical protein
MDRWKEKWSGWKRDGLVEGDMEGMEVGWIDDGEQKEGKVGWIGGG